MRIRDPQIRHRWRAGRSTRSRSGGTRAEVRAIPHLPEIQRQPPPPQTDYQTVSFAILEKESPEPFGWGSRYGSGRIGRTVHMAVPKDKGHPVGQGSHAMRSRDNTGPKPSSHPAPI